MTPYELRALKTGDLFRISDPDGKNRDGVFTKLKSFNIETNEYTWTGKRNYTKIPHLSFVMFLAYVNDLYVIFLFDNNLYCSSGIHWMISFDYNQAT